MPYAPAQSLAPVLKPQGWDIHIRTSLDLSMLHLPDVPEQHHRVRAEHVTLDAAARLSSVQEGLKSAVRQLRSSTAEVRGHLDGALNTYQTDDVRHAYEKAQARGFILPQLKGHSQAGIPVISLQATQIPCSWRQLDQRAKDNISEVLSVMVRHSDLGTASEEMHLKRWGVVQRLRNAQGAFGGNSTTARILMGQILGIITRPESESDESEFTARALPRKQLTVGVCTMLGLISKVTNNKLAISDRTRKQHMRNIYANLGISSRYGISNALIKRGNIIMQP